MQCFHLMKVNITVSAYMDGWIMGGACCSLSLTITWCFYKKYLYSGLNNVVCTIKITFWGCHCSNKMRCINSKSISGEKLLKTQLCLSSQGQFLCNPLRIHPTLTPSLHPVTHAHTWRHAPKGGHVTGVFPFAF